MEPMYVICFYWQGDRWKSDNTPSDLYGNLINRVGTVDTVLAARYINNLFYGVDRFAERPFKFICFTNEDVKLDPLIEIREFKPITDVGVLPRMWMFSEEAGLFGHQVLCLDLDVVIVGSMEPLMSYQGQFCARSKFKPGEEYKLDGDVFSFKAGKETEDLLWKPFIKDIPKALAETQGRERYWFRKCVNQTADRWDEVASQSVLSYKWHILKNHKRLDDACLVSFHGHPRPHQAKDAWVKEYWK